MRRALRSRKRGRKSRRHCYHFDYYRNRCGSNKFSKRTIVRKETLGVDEANKPQATLVVNLHQGVQSTQQRGRYFSVFRNERKLLTLLSNQPANSVKTDSRGDRRKLRCVYYRILPLLIPILRHPNDLRALRYLEWYYYQQLNKAADGRIRPAIDRLRVRSVLYQNTGSVSSFQAKLY